MKTIVTSLCIYLCLFETVIAQSLFNQNGTISISENGVLAVSESFTNDGRLVNNGRMVVGQDWLNNGDYDENSTGDLVLNGTNDQFINHNAQTFQRVTISGGDKIFQADLTINESIDFSEGKLFSESGARLIIGPNATISGGNESSYVVGGLYISSGETRFYPVGTEDLYLPITLSELQDPTASIGAFAVDGLIGNEIDNTLAEINDQYYWELDLLSGESVGSIFSVEFRDISFLTDMEFAVLAQTDDQDNEIQEVLTVVTGNSSIGTLTSQEVINGPFFVVGRIFSPSERPPINVLNLVSPNGDGINDFLEIENIGAYPGSVVTLFNRLGQKIYEVTDYNNADVRFEGLSNTKDGFDVPEGTYFYVITSGDEELASGFFEVLR